MKLIRYSLIIIIFTLTSSAYCSPPTPLVIELETSTHASPDLKVSNFTRKISAQEINKNKLMNIAQILEIIPGLEIHDVYSDGSHLSVSTRGFGDNATSNLLVLWDGIPLLQPDLSGPNYRLFAVENVAQIEVSSSSSGVLYGEQAVGGVINISTQAPQKNSQQFSVSIGDHATQFYSMNLQHILNSTWRYRLYGMAHQSKHERIHNHENEKTLAAQLNYRTAREQFELALNLQDNFLQLPGALTLSEAEQNPQQAKNTKDFSRAQDQQLRTHITMSVADEWSWDINALFHAMQGHGILQLPFSDARHNHLLQHTIAGTLHINTIPIKIKAGTDFSAGDYSFTNMNYFSTAEQTSQAVYGWINIPLNQQFEIVTGDRVAFSQAEINSSFKHAKSNNTANVTTLELTWQCQPNTRLFVQRAGSFRFPKTDENAFSLHNLPLKTQYGTSYETGIKWHHTSLSLYQLNLTDEIVFVPSVNGYTFGYNQNVSPTRRKGFIADTRFSLSPSWEIALGYGFVDARFLTGPFAEKIIPHVAPHNFTLTNAIEPAEHWHWTINANALSSRFPGGDFTNQSQRLPATLIFNTSLIYQQPHYSLTARINNLTNQLSFAESTYTLVNNIPTTFVYPGIGRTILLTGSYDF